MNKPILGRGLDSLLPSEEGNVDAQEIEIELLTPNPFQPRVEFDNEKLAELTQSIKELGVVQPVIVTQIKNGYQIVAGERRWRAAKAAGLERIPVVIRDYTEQECLEIALVENIQRENLNPIEEANAYKTMIEKLGYKQEELAERLGKSRSAVTNTMRLLGLPQQIRDAVREGKISSGHARSLLSLQEMSEQIKAFRQIVGKSLSVRETEKMVKKLIEGAKTTTIRQDKPIKKDVFVRDIEDRMRELLGTAVRIRHGSNGGMIEIEYFSDSDLNRVIDIILNKNQ